MNVVTIHDVNPKVKITSVADTAMLLNLMYHETVEELLESFTDFTDFDIIAELVDTLNLPIIAVKEGSLFYGYIHEGGVCA